jgi:sugar porter (SP) family MFS transporter
VRQAGGLNTGQLSSFLITHENKNQVMNKRKIFGWSIIVSLGGFLFGFDTAVISGAEQSIQQYWSLSSEEHGLTMSIALIGTILGALSGSYPSDKFGRKNALIIIASLYLFSSIGTALAGNWYLFLIFRFLGGIGVGASSVTAPVYIAEISPPGLRGRLVAMFQFNIVLGILISYFSNYLIGASDASWRWMLGVQALPSLLFLILLRFVPESPRWLFLKRNNAEEARRILRIINPATADEVLENIKNTEIEEKASGNTDRLFTKNNKFPVFLAIVFAIFNQVSGINAIIYYAPRIFEMSGLERSSSLLSTVGIGAVNLIFTLLAVNFIDKIGRRKLMLIGSFGLIATLGFVALNFYSQNPGGLLITICLLVYIAFFAFSQGAVIWVFISEIFPNQVRAKGQTLGSFTHWCMAALITFSFPPLIEKLGLGNIFLFFSVMMVIQLLFVWKIMPETKGKSLEQIEHNLVLH